MDQRNQTIPRTVLGTWAFCIQIGFLIVIAISVFLVLGLNVLDFGDRWWDVTVAIAFPASIIAFILGIIALTKKDRRPAVWVAVGIGIATVLFALLHSVFISD